MILCGFFITTSSLYPIDGSDVGYITFMSTFLCERFQLPVAKQRLIPKVSTVSNCYT